MITKRILGLGLAGIGLLAIVGSFANDLLNLSEYQGIGPQQMIVIVAGSALLVVGLTLIPLGNKPA